MTLDEVFGSAILVARERLALACTPSAKARPYSSRESVAQSTKERGADV